MINTDCNMYFRFGLAHDVSDHLFGGLVAIWFHDFLGNINVRHPAKP